MNNWLIYDHLEMWDWLTLFDYVWRRGTVGTQRGIGFVIHSKEKGHNKAHLHAKYQGKELVLEIPSGEIIQGSLGSKKDREAQRWVRDNGAFLQDKWDELVEGINLVA